MVRQTVSYLPSILITYADVPLLSYKTQVGTAWKIYLQSFNAIRTSCRINIPTKNKMRNLFRESRNRDLFVQIHKQGSVNSSIHSAPGFHSHGARVANYSVFQAFPANYVLIFLSPILWLKLNQSCLCLTLSNKGRWHYFEHCLTFDRFL